MGAMDTNHMMIKSGAIHRANGGYLVIQANELLANPLAWDALKRSLRSGEICVENIGEQHSAFPTSSMRPQAIPMKAKIILVGSTPVLRLLRNADPDFRRYFKVAAEFDTVMDRTPKNIGKYAAFVAGQVSEKETRHFDKTGVAALLDYSTRLTQDQDKLTTRFRVISDMMSEADYWADRYGDDKVESRHVARAISERRYGPAWPKRSPGINSERFGAYLYQGKRRGTGERSGCVLQRGPQLRQAQQDNGQCVGWQRPDRKRGTPRPA